MIDESGLPVIPHEWAGGRDCCGCLIVEPRGELADLVCNECGAVVRTIAAADVPMVLSQMLLSQRENYHAHCALWSAECGEKRISRRPTS